MKICTSVEMREIDAKASEKFNIPSIVLMENAAISCLSEICDFDKFVILCGKGNNAGDGLAIARHLINRGKKVKIYLLFGNDFSGDALINYNILKSMNADFYGIYDDIGIDLALCDCVVDAIFGTGIKGEVKTPVREIIELINESEKFVLSVDVPSGIDADTGKIGSVAVRANKTVTFAAYKSGLLLYPAADFTGEIICADISVPKEILKNITRNTLDREHIEDIMPSRCENSHKGDYGKIFIIGGSCGMAGAVTMAIEAAFAAGAGVVTACVPCEINDIIQKTSINAMTYPCDFSCDKDKIIEKMQNYDVILFGNGIGRGDEVMPLLESVLKEAKVPLVIDADGLYALSKKPDMLKNCKTEVILTPHSAEMARLIGKSIDFVEDNRIEAADNFSNEFGVTLVLKGNHTIITAPKSELYVNLNGNSGMATAGSGDVLAGMCAAFLARTKAADAAKIAVYLHGMAGDGAADKIGAESMTALHIIEAVSHILPVEKI